MSELLCACGRPLLRRMHDGFDFHGQTTCGDFLGATVCTYSRSASLDSEALSRLAPGDTAMCLLYFCVSSKKLLCLAYTVE